MDISNDSKQLIAKEFHYIATKIREEEDVLRKNYFLSGAYGVTSRVFNTEFDIALVLIHNELQNAYMAINNAVISRIKGEERVMQLPETLFASLAVAIEELGNAIVDDSDISVPLAKIATMAYTTTGNGYYLYQKGVIGI